MKLKSNQPLTLNNFSEHVEIDPATGCWNWKHSKTSFGYGMKSVKRRPKGTHRISWEIHRGPIPNGLHVLHKCDNPPCCNPSHLFLGTQADNMRDCARKGRHKHGSLSFGEAHHSSKLTETQVREIREKYARGISTVKLGREYGISKTNARNIVRGLVWKNVG